MKRGDYVTFAESSHPEDFIGEVLNVFDNGTCNVRWVRLSNELSEIHIHYTYYTEHLKRLTPKEVLMFKLGVNL